MRTRAPVLIGRADELTAALTRLHAAVRSGDGPACFYVGEPGVGKSRLVKEVSEQAHAAGLVVVRGRANAVSPASPLRPWAEILASVHRRGLPEGSLGGYRPLLGRVLPQLSSPGQLGTGEAAPITAFAEAVLRVLTRIGESSGCLVVLEDLQEADPESLAVLEYLLDNVTGTPVALTGALRDEPSDARDVLTAAERRGVLDLVPVQSLDPQHTDVLVASCLGVQRPLPELAELAWHTSGGNPLAVEELLYDLVDSGQLRLQEEEWVLSAAPALAPPPSMLQRVAARVERLGGLVRQVLVTAAFYGERFPLATTMAAVGCGEAPFLECLQAGVDAQLVTATEVAGWYQFHHPLTHGAVLGLVGAVERRQAASRLAEVVLAEDPALTGPTCRLAARLFAAADRPDEAGALYATAGRLALQDGAVEWAVADLDASMRLRAPDETLIGQLVSALIQTCQLNRAAELLAQAKPAVSSPHRQRRALTHLDLAWGSALLGWTEQSHLQLASARVLAAGGESELVQVSCDVLDLAKHAPPPGKAADEHADRLRATAEAAERLAHHACDEAERRTAAESACRAWSELIERLEKRDDYQEVNRCGERIIALADRYDLPFRRLSGMRVAALDRWYSLGDDLPLRTVVDQAHRLGAVVHAIRLEPVLALHQVMTGDGSLAPVQASLNACVEHATRLRHAVVLRSAFATLAMAAGLRADRASLAEALARFEAVGGRRDVTWSMVAGTGSAVCLALQGRDGDALALLEEMGRRLQVSSYYRSMPLGLTLLLATLAGSAGPAEVAAALQNASRMRWNRQFLHWAAAVHAGRRGDQVAAHHHLERALVDAEIFPLLRQLAARLVAPAAARDGWGTPVADLHQAEAWFHARGIAAAARSCRDVLRTLGVATQQHRHGAEAIPAWLRTAGVTVREYEIALLVGERIANAEIGARLHISPRTVEKHISSLLAKLALPDRRALIDKLAATPTGAHPA